MIKCHKCNVNIITKVSKCPLCHSPLAENDGIDVFPMTNFDYRKHNLLIKLLFACSLIAIFICLFINFSISNKISWAYFVTLAIISFWITLIEAIKGRKNFIRMLFLEMITILLLSYLWDKSTGFKMWSINYCLPFLCVLYMISILIILPFKSKLKKEFVFYAMINSIIGLTPGILIIFNKINVYWPSYISVILSIIILVFLFVFDIKQIKEELERRFHI